MAACNSPVYLSVVFIIECGLFHELLTFKIVATILIIMLYTGPMWLSCHLVVAADNQLSKSDRDKSQVLVTLSIRKCIVFFFFSPGRAYQVFYVNLF